MGWLSRFILSACGVKVPEAEDIKADPSERNVGIHLLSNYGEIYEHITSDVENSGIKDLIDRLNWESGFYQVICTIEPGVSIEVGGSLNGYDGLSSVYRNRLKNIESVMVKPPETRGEMIEIMQSFAGGNDIWHTKHSWN